MRTVSRDEVDQRCRVLQKLAELRPTRIGLQRLVVRRVVNLCAYEIERRHARIAAARDVQRGEIQRQTQEVVAQRAGHELVDFAADLVRAALHDLGRGVRTALGEGEWIGEGFDQPDRRQDRLPVRTDDRRAVRVQFEARDVLVQHRVAEAIDRVRELRRDRRIQVDVDVTEQMDRRRDLTRELFEHEMLILRLGAELRDLEQAFAVPLRVGDLYAGS